MATPSSSPTNVPFTAWTVSERSGGEEVQLVAAGRREAVRPTDLQLALEVIEQVEAEVGLDADVGLQLQGLEAALVGVPRVDERGAPELTEVHRKGLVAAFDPHQRRAIF